jgi:hypothetical protein
MLENIMRFFKYKDWCKENKIDIYKLNIINDIKEIIKFMEAK